ncbi:MAG: VOC family protein [Solirubrobacterales bacterium]|nr:VOC family protein [Solirubrobacterales bacterium]
MIALRRIDHVALRVADVPEAAARWAVQFGLTARSIAPGRALLSCDDEPYALELLAGAEPGHDHTAFELARTCPLELAAAHLRSREVVVEQREDALFCADPEGNRIQLMPHRETGAPPAHARSTSSLPGDHPRKLGHVNFLTGRIAAGVEFYTEALGMRLTDWLGDAGVWFHVNSDHHVMALVDKGRAHFHHLALDVVDVGQMRSALDHLGRHGRWLGWGPARHGVGGNVASYVRIVEEACFVELYVDMEQLDVDHRPRRWPDDRFSSNTWGPLPPRSYFRFDPVAIEYERESLETQGRLLPDPT